MRRIAIPCVCTEEQAEYNELLSNLFINAGESALDVLKEIGHDPKEPAIITIAYIPGVGKARDVWMEMNATSLQQEG